MKADFNLLAKKQFFTRQLSLKVILLHLENVVLQLLLEVKK